MWTSASTPKTTTMPDLTPRNPDGPEVTDDMTREPTAAQEPAPTRTGPCPPLHPPSTVSGRGLYSPGGAHSGAWPLERERDATRGSGSNTTGLARLDVQPGANPARGAPHRTIRGARAEAGAEAAWKVITLKLGEKFKGETLRPLPSLAPLRAEPSSRPGRSCLPRPSLPPSVKVTRGKNDFNPVPSASANSGMRRTEIGRQRVAGKGAQDDFTRGRDRRLEPKH
ncbi:uncharacterized protein BXZ73DRAFT_80980 [Epithele typhae]|uniref:uncharacterized protein n=1 Tax=Epithele typhae TaxID=378194 RepID=UPI002008812D|nr:uncharacterized protein BXZ73DRAFT_80980 [Epithele typhae]KAH9916728.1 hypothetical protein BXZ73DRAFT_80980 [Epithele typhae]